jgi:hypothetical protein
MRTLVLRPVGLALALGVCPLASAQAQLLSRYIPDYAPGLTETPENTQARVQPEYRSDGVRAGSFVIRPRLAESLGYDSNVDGVQGGRASAAIDTQATVSAESDWSRNSVAAQLSVDDQRYPARPVQDFTNWSAGLSGTYDVGLDQVSGSYQHLSVVQTPRDLGAVLSVPIPFQVDDVRIGTAFLTQGRLSFVPDLDVASYRFSNVVAPAGDGLNATLGQTWQSRLVYQPELATRYELSPKRDVLLVLRGTVIDFTSHPAGVGNFNSVGGAVLAGFDYTGTGVFRYRALIGYQQRNYASARFATIRSPIIEASVTWKPQLMTTLTGIVRREIDDSTNVNFIATTVTSVQLNVAHELRRNVVLTGFGEYQRADFGSGSGVGVSSGSAAGPGVSATTTPTQNIYSAGLGATWFLNRRTQLGVSYQFIDRSGGAQLSYLENVALFTVGFGL